MRERKKNEKMRERLDEKSCENKKGKKQQLLHPFSEHQEVKNPRTAPKNRAVAGLRDSTTRVDRRVTYDNICSTSFAIQKDNDPDKIADTPVATIVVAVGRTEYFAQIISK
jgi:hypothetical protein